MKKFFGVFIFAAAMIFVAGQPSTVQAAEVYMGTYSDGDNVYLLTETVQKLPAGRAGLYKCTVRAGRSYLNYEFFCEDTGWQYNNSEGYRGYVYDGSSPVAANICNYLRGNY